MSVYQYNDIINKNHSSFHRSFHVQNKLEGGTRTKNNNSQEPVPAYASTADALWELLRIVLVVDSSCVECCAFLWLKEMNALRRINNYYRMPV